MQTVQQTVKILQVPLLDWFDMPVIVHRQVPTVVKVVAQRPFSFGPDSSADH